MFAMLLVSALAVAQYSTPAEKPAAQDTARARTTAPAAGNRDAMNQNQSRTPTTQAALRQDMHRLWSQHIALTHNYIVSAFAGLGDTTQVALRLLRNQDEIADAIKPFYGPAAGTQLATMLRGHIQHATHAVAAAKATQTAMAGGHQQGQWDSQWNKDKEQRADTANRMGQPRRDTTAARPAQAQQSRDTSALTRGRDTTGMRDGARGGDTLDVNTTVAMLRANADSIAGFLNSANPRHWPRATLQSALSMHVDLMVQAVQARARGDWSASVAALDASHRQAMQIADVLTDGIVKQFPNRFTGRTTAMSGQ